MYPAGSDCNYKLDYNPMFLSSAKEFLSVFEVSIIPTNNCTYQLYLPLVSIDETFRFPRSNKSFMTQFSL